MVFSDTILVSVTVFTDTKFSVTNHSARNFLTHFLYQRFHDTLVSKKCLYLKHHLCFDVTVSNSF